MLELKNISKDIEGKLGYVSTVLDKINLSVAENEFCCLLAPAGAGKSTLLKIIAGIYKKTSGEIILKHQKPEVVFSASAAFIPSAPASFPWLNVEDNIKFFIRNSGIPAAEENSRIKDACALTGLTGFEKHRPDNQSLGFRFRISLARVLAINSPLLLLDEPFSKMNEATRKEMYTIIGKIREQKELTILLATSCVEEAYLLSDTVYVMSGKPVHLLKALKPENGREKGKRELNSSAYTEFMDLVEKSYSGTTVRTVLSE